MRKLHGDLIRPGSFRRNPDGDHAMSIFLCRAVATRAAFAQHTTNVSIQSEQDMFEAKGLELSRQARRKSTTSNIGLRTPLIMKSLIVAPLAFLAVMTVNQALASAKAQENTIEAHNCSATVQNLTEAGIAQIGKARATEDHEPALLPALVSQQNKVRQASVPALSVVSYVRCLQGTN
jgi:hypothetical protein